MITGNRRRERRANGPLQNQQEEPQEHGVAEQVRQPEDKLAVAGSEGAGLVKSVFKK
jgi:hypothetical protein